MKRRTKEQTGWVVIARPVFEARLERSAEWRARFIIDPEVDLLECEAEPASLVADQQWIVHAGLDAQEDGIRRTKRPLDKIFDRLSENNMQTSVVEQVNGSAVMLAIVN